MTTLRALVQEDADDRASEANGLLRKALATLRPSEWTISNGKATHPDVVGHAELGSDGTLYQITAQYAPNGVYPIDRPADLILKEPSPC